MVQDVVNEFVFSDSEREEINLCLTCPFPECTNCLDSKNGPREPGERPRRKRTLRQDNVRDLLLRTDLPLYKIAGYAHVSMATAKAVQAELRDEGLI